MTNWNPTTNLRAVFLILLLALCLLVSVPLVADEDDDDDGGTGGPSDPKPIGPIALPGPGVGENIGPQVPIIQRPDPLATACNLLEWGLANNNQQAIDMGLLGILGFGGGTVAEALVICADVP